MKTDTTQTKPMEIPWYLQTYYGKLKLGNKGQTIAYNMLIALIGLVLCAVILTMIDQIINGSLWGVAIQLQLNGTILNLWDWGFSMLTVVVVLTFVMGMIASSYIASNQ